MDNGFDSRFNRLVAFLESGDFGNAELQLGQLVNSDTSFVPMAEALVNVFNPGSDSTTQAKFNELYYRSAELSPNELKIRMQDFDDATQQVLLSKIEAFIENRGLDHTAYAGLGIRIRDYSELDSASLVGLATDNPFNEQIVIMASDLLATSDNVDAYTLLDQSLEFNPYSVPILKAHAMSAININLPEYARETLMTLSNLMSPVDYAQFEIAWYKAKAEQEEQPWFN